MTQRRGGRGSNRGFKQPWEDAEPIGAVDHLFDRYHRDDATGRFARRVVLGTAAVGFLAYLLVAVAAADFMLAVGVAFVAVVVVLVGFFWLRRRRS